MSKKNHPECVHGLLWKACHLCYQKTEKEILSETAPKHKKDSACNYLLIETEYETTEIDTAYDLETSDY